MKQDFLELKAEKDTHFPLFIVNESLHFWYC